MWGKEGCMHANERRKLHKRALQRANTFVDMKKAVKLFEAGNEEAFKALIADLVTLKNGDLWIGKNSFKYVISATEGEDTVYSIFKYGKEKEIQRVEDPEDVKIVVALKKAIFKFINY